MEAQTNRIAVFEDTLRHIRTSWQKEVSYSIAHQRCILEKDILPPLSKPSFQTNIIVSSLRSFEAAAQYKNQRVAVLNFASATHPGGGVKHGSAAQEEALCRVSTLFPCLNDSLMWNQFYTPHQQVHTPLYNSDIIYTPEVVVFKDDDYHLLKEPFKVNVITCAAPNLRYTPTPENLLQIHEQRARRIFHVAVEQNDILILGAFGCGAFRNDPTIVARAYKNVLSEFLGHYKTIEFAVYCNTFDKTNYNAFSKIL